MSVSFRVKVNAAVGIGLAMLVILGLVGYGSIQEFYDADQEVKRMVDVQGHLETIRLDAERAEVVQLRYQLTGDPADRDEFRAMTYRVRGAIEHLGGRLKAPDQKQRLAELERTLSARFEVLAEAIRLRGSGRAAVELLFNERGVESGRGIASVSEVIGEREREMIQAQEERAGTNAKFASWITLWGGVLAVALLVWAIWVINRYERDRRRVEGQLRGAEERLALALEASNSAVWDWNIGREEIYLSAGWTRVLGAQAQATTTTPAELLALVHPDDLKQVQKVIQGALNGATPDYREEHRVRQVNGDWIWILSRGNVVRRDPEGRPLRMAGINQDISDRKRIDLALREHDQQLRLALETAGMAGWNWDVAGDAFTWHDSPAHLAGPSPAGGYPGLQDLVHPEDLVHFIRTLTEAARTGSVYRDEFRIIRTDGRTAWVLARGRTEHDAAGRVTRIAGVAQDISELKDAEQALRANERQMRLLTNAFPEVIA